MAGTAFPFPRSSTPGARPGEGEGRYLNCHAVQEGGRTYVRRDPGLVTLSATGKSAPLRGMLDVNGVKYAVFNGAVVTVSAGGAVTTLTGAIPGSDGVTLARNNKVTGGVSTPDIVAVRESGGAYLLSASAVSAYPDADLPASVNSVDFLGGYFLFSLPDGRIFASDLNSTAINALSFATAENRADGLRRIAVSGNIAYAFGSSTIEPYVNVGTAPFPLQRAATVPPIGILTTMAVAGHEEAWNNPVFFVASDRTVRTLQGYETATVSTADVDRFIAASTIASLELCVFVWNGRGFVAVSSDAGTWVYDVSANAWHEKTSKLTTPARWRASRSIYSNGLWVFGDTLGGNLQALTATLSENGQPLPWLIQSGPLKDFPARIACRLSADFTEAAEQVLVSWSHDGGKTWSDELTRSLADAGRWPLSVASLGLGTQHGLIVRFRGEGTADFSFSGATAERLAARGT
ncbi:packaged DNA stabilization protein [Bosea sp. BK604]|uniref:packaged DNA stabilization protein n=1 Tax=Bosea sp. BK604 TaxID=2512180 RepID=UPI00104A16AD|nr:packaged DNA stabilization protein [Bosea sp. BK604]TCR65442.1 phage stabilization protein [Bosea sp. BK604]